MQRFEPSRPLAKFVEHYWEVTWSDQPRVVRETAPSPSVHIVFEAEKSKIHGVYRQRFSRTTEGTGRVLGVKFRPGGFRTFLGGSVADLTGKIIDSATVLGNSILKLEKSIWNCGCAEQSFSLVEEKLLSLLPESDDKLDLITRIMTRLEVDRTLTSVEQIVDEFSVGHRSLQRIFRDYVGVSPKWTIQRFRLIESAERMRDTQSNVNFAKLALELGFSDQAHMIRKFKLFFGTTPDEYNRSLRNQDSASSS